MQIPFEPEFQILYNKLDDSNCYHTQIIRVKNSNTLPYSESRALIQIHKELKRAKHYRSKIFFLLLS